MASSNGKRSSETESSLELLRVQQAADRINKRIALDHTVEFRSVFVKEIFPVKKAFVMDLSLFIDAGPFGEDRRGSGVLPIFFGDRSKRSFRNVITTIKRTYALKNPTAKIARLAAAVDRFVRRAADEVGESLQSRTRPKRRGSCDAVSQRPDRRSTSVHSR
jgi:hypothetical protein